MKLLISIALLYSGLLSTSLAQQNAVTDQGEAVLLYEDGTWKYKDHNNTSSEEIPTNSKKFTKDSKSSFLLKSNKLNIGVWLDPKVWSFKKATDNVEAEYELTTKEGDLYGMIISEKIEIPLETLRSIALTNGQAAAPDLHVVNEEYRNVNGLKVLLLQMDGTLQGIKFSYYGYYFSNSKGTVQFITYTSQDLLKEQKPICETLLNGLIETN